MSTRKPLTLGLLLTLALASPALAQQTSGLGPSATQQTPGLGQPISQQDLAPWDIDASPDGTGLPPGSGTPKDGLIVYQQKCLACHGANGAGASQVRLTGGQGTLGVPGKKPVKTVGSFWPYATTVFAYIRRSMPYNNAKSLTPDELYAVTAYILNLNKIIGDDDVMNAQTLPQVKMPNRDGFIPWHRGL
jgi:cytochrome c